MEELSKELGLVLHQLWSNYEKAADNPGIPERAVGTELVLGG